MKVSLRAGVLGLCLAVPGVSIASTVNFESAGSQCTLLFDPHGSSPSQLPSPCYYRSYDCRIGGKPVVTVYLPPPPPHGQTIPGGNDTPKGNIPVITPTLPQGNDPSGPCCPASVPAPASSEMGLAGIAAAAAWSWLRTRRQARV